MGRYILLFIFLSASQECFGSKEDGQLCPFLKKPCFWKTSEKIHKSKQGLQNSFFEITLPRQTLLKVDLSEGCMASEKFVFHESSIPCRFASDEDRSIYNRWFCSVAPKHLNQTVFIWAQQCVPQGSGAEGT